MSTEIATRDTKAELMERVLVHGNLAQLSPGDRLAYYQAVCESVGLNPLTKPFDYIMLQGKLTLYAKRDATEQLRKIHGVSIVKLEKDWNDTLYVVTAYAKDKHGREDVSTGAVDTTGLKGEAKANALMKGETKAKRRVTLSICGLGFLDETEVVTIPGAQAWTEKTIDVETGEIDDPSGARSETAAPAGRPSRGEGDPAPQSAPDLAPQRDPFAAITMLTKLGGGTFKASALEAYFGPGIRSKGAIEKLRADSPEIYAIGFDKLDADYHAARDSGQAA